MSSSNTSAPLRIEWRPSRLLCAALLLLGAAAALSVWLSALPDPARAAGTALALVGAVLSCWREVRRARFLVVWSGPGTPAVQIRDGEEVAFEVHSVVLRGTLAQWTLRSADGRTARWLWWPDTLSRSARRELQLIATAPDRPSVLPLVAG